MSRHRYIAYGAAPTGREDAQTTWKGGDTVSTLSYNEKIVRVDRIAVTAQHWQSAQKRLPDGCTQDEPDMHGPAWSSVEAWSGSLHMYVTSTTEDLKDLVRRILS